MLRLDETINLLLIEDNEDHIILTRDAIISGCRISPERVFVRGNLADALEYLSMSGKDTVILLDLNLPDSKGMATLLKVKSRYGNLPVIVLTSMGEDEMGLRSLKEGAQDFVCKSDLRPDLIEKTIRHSIERKRIENQLQKKIEELEKFNTLAVGREKRIIELKQEINLLQKEQGKDPAYDLSFLENLESE